MDHACIAIDGYAVVAVCLCGWQTDEQVDENSARTLMDAHLSEVSDGGT